MAFQKMGLQDKIYIADSLEDLIKLPNSSMGSTCWVIETAEKYRGKVLYIKRDDASLPEGRYFVSEIIGSSVFDTDSGELLGTLCDVSETGANDVWHIKNDGREYLVPAIPSVIVSVDIEKERIELRPLKGIFDDED